MSQSLTVGATNLIRLRRLRYETTGAYITDATVNCTLKDAEDATVAGPLAMAYVAGSTPTRGEYRGTLAEDAPLTVGASYTAEITAVKGSNERTFNCACIAVEG